MCYGRQDTVRRAVGTHTQRPLLCPRIAHQAGVSRTQNFRQTSSSKLQKSTSQKTRHIKLIDGFTSRPRVTISVSAPDDALDGELLTLDLPPGISLTDFCGFVEAETGIPLATQQFYLNGQPLATDNRTMEEAGIKDGEMLAMLVNRGGSSGAQQRGGSGGAGGIGGGARGGAAIAGRGGHAQQQQQQQQNSRRGGAAARPSADQIETIRLQFLGDPSRLAALRAQAPDLFAVREDSTRFREAWERRVAEEERAQRERQNQIALLNDDPFNVEAQKRIEEMIRQENVLQNLQDAYEATPEGKHSLFLSF